MSGPGRAQAPDEADLREIARRLGELHSNQNGIAYGNTAIWDAALALLAVADADLCRPQPEPVLRAALERIARWHGELPATGKFWEGDPTRPVSFAADHGSNGERDYMRRIALDSLDAAPPPPAAAPAEPTKAALLDAAEAWIRNAPHGDNCFLHDDGGEYDRCFCGKDSLLAAIEGAAAAPPRADAPVDAESRPTFGELPIGARFKFYKDGSLLTKTGSRSYDAAQWGQHGNTAPDMGQLVIPAALAASSVAQVEPSISTPPPAQGVSRVAGPRSTGSAPSPSGSWPSASIADAGANE